MVRVRMIVGNFFTLSGFLLALPGIAIFMLGELIVRRDYPRHQRDVADDPRDDMELPA